MRTDWETCSRREGCPGAAISHGGACLAHLDSNGELQTALAGLVQGAGLDARGVAFDERLLAAILESAPRTAEGKPLLQQADFTNARFARGVRFDGVVFGPEARFYGADFAGRVSFGEASFGDGADFRRASFGEAARFERCAFGKQASFAHADFGNGARFERAGFGDHANLADSTWGSDAYFAGATFGWRMRADRSVFGDRAVFRGVRFAAEASLRKTTFGVKAAFEGASFEGDASFSGSTFGNDANFAGTRFAPGISFRRVRFGRLTTFRRATFGDRAWFTSADFGPGAAFKYATFEGRTRFNLTTFAERANFDETTFSGHVTFEGADFRGRTTFRLATFERTQTFGPLAVHGLLSLEGASFREAVRLDVAAPRLLASRASFPKGADVRVRRAEIVLDEADFGGPGILAAVPSGAGEPRPRLLSVRGANVADLVLSGLDLSACRFCGAHNLDRVRIEGDSFLGQSPAGTSRRRVIAEEQEWRARRRRRWPRWTAPEFAFAAEGVEKPRRLNPDEIAAVYRALRRGRESNGDAPGAADFYFGEMEMRRHDPKSPRAERAILWLYWLVSGYALRSLRALAALLVTIVVFALLLRGFGFTPPVGLTRSLLFSAESTSSLFRTPETTGTRLTEAGEALQIALRLLGPLFFGLALLSLRGRVRR